MKRLFLILSASMLFFACQDKGKANQLKAEQNVREYAETRVAAVAGNDSVKTVELGEKRKGICSTGLNKSIAELAKLQKEVLAGKYDLDAFLHMCDSLLNEDEVASMCTENFEYIGNNVEKYKGQLRDAYPVSVKLKSGKTEVFDVVMGTDSLQPGCTLTELQDSTKDYSAQIIEIKNAVIQSYR